MDFSPSDSYKPKESAESEGSTEPILNMFDIMQDNGPAAIFERAQFNIPYSPKEIKNRIDSLNLEIEGTRLAKDTDNWKYGADLNELGALETALGQYDKGREHLKESANLFKKLLSEPPKKNEVTALVRALTDYGTALVGEKPHGKIDLNNDENSEQRQLDADQIFTEALKLMKGSEVSPSIKTDLLRERGYNNAHNIAKMKPPEAFQKEWAPKAQKESVNDLREALALADKNTSNAYKYERAVIMSYLAYAESNNPYVKPEEAIAHYEGAIKLFEEYQPWQVTGEREAYSAHGYKKDLDLYTTLIEYDRSGVLIKAGQNERAQAIKQKIIDIGEAMPIRANLRGSGVIIKGEEGDSK